MTKVKITKDMFDKMEYDTAIRGFETGAPMTVAEPTIMIVLSGSDLNAASYQLVKSLLNPASNTIVTILVQESILQDFTTKVQEKLVPDVPLGAFGDNYTATLQKVKQFNAKTMQPTSEKGDNVSGPTIVYDFTHEQLGIEVGYIATLHAFRTVKEANALCSKQGVNFVHASIWTENHAQAYEIIAAQTFRTSFINCLNVPIDCLEEVGEKHSAALMQNGYHYERIIGAEGSAKNIVFPYGTIFAN